MSSVAVPYLAVVELNASTAQVSALVFAFSSPVLQYALSGRHLTLAVFLFTGFLVLFYDAFAHKAECSRLLFNPWPPSDLRAFTLALSTGSSFC